MNLYTWALQWNIPAEAIADLRMQMGYQGTLPVVSDATSEAGALKRVRLEAAHKNKILWRNNRGVWQDDYGNWIRYGLANDSIQMNKQIKSHDLIGIDKSNGQFISREMKKPGWTYKGTPEEVAQEVWLQLILSSGGDAAFATGEGSL